MTKPGPNIRLVISSAARNLIFHQKGLMAVAGSYYVYILTNQNNRVM